jgi:hypothetical protein
MIAAQIIAVVLALVVSFVILVMYGVDNTPTWLLYASFPIMAIGGGAAINMILFGVPI